jgi:hypothetical protein
MRLAQRWVAADVSCCRPTCTVDDAVDDPRVDGRPRPRMPASDVVRLVAHRVDDLMVRTYGTYVPNKTISVPDDVVPIIESLDVPFSHWVTEQLRRHAAQSTLGFPQQLVADAALAKAERRLAKSDARAVGERMERTAPW